jgi:hypothetical protein
MHPPGGMQNAVWHGSDATHVPQPASGCDTQLPVWQTHGGIAHVVHDPGPPLVGVPVLHIGPPSGTLLQVLAVWHSTGGHMNGVPAWHAPPWQLCGRHAFDPHDVPLGWSGLLQMPVLVSHVPTA